MESSHSHAVIALAVIAAALGFFADAYDLLLYSIVRNQSLVGIGLSGSQILDVGIDLLNAQLVGMLGVVTVSLIGAITILTAFIALFQLEENYGKDLNYAERI